MTVSNVFIAECKDFENRHGHLITVYNMTKDKDITEYVEPSSIRIDGEKQGSYGLISTDKSEFDIITDIDETIAGIVEKGDRLQIKDLFQGELKHLFIGKVQDIPTDFHNLEHKHRIQMRDMIRDGLEMRFEINEVKIDWYLCNNNQPAKSLAHYLAYKTGFIDADLLLEDVTDLTGTYVKVPYAQFEKGAKVMNEFAELVESVLGNLFVNQEGKLVLTTPINDVPHIVGPDPSGAFVTNETRGLLITAQNNAVIKYVTIESGSADTTTGKVVFQYWLECIDDNTSGEVNVIELGSNKVSIVDLDLVLEAGKQYRLMGTVVEGNVRMANDDVAINYPMDNQDIIITGETGGTDAYYPWFFKISTETIRTVIDAEVRKRISKKPVPARHDKVSVIFDKFNIAARQECWMLYEKASYDKQNDLANMRLAAGSSSAWYKIQLVTPICLNLEDPVIYITDEAGNDMSAYFSFDMELSMTGGRVKFHNLHQTTDILIQQFKIFGQPLEKLAGNEASYTEVDNPEKPLEIKNKFIQDSTLAELNAKFGYYRYCIDTEQYDVPVYFSPYLNLGDKVFFAHRVNKLCEVVSYQHKPEKNYLVTQLGLSTYARPRYELFAGIFDQLTATDQYTDEQQIINELKQDGMFSEGLPVPIPSGLSGYGTYNNLWLEWEEITTRGDLLGYNVYITDGVTAKKYFASSNSINIAADRDTAYTVQVSAKCIAGESEKCASIQIKTLGGINWEDLLNVVVNTPDLADLAVTNAKIAELAVYAANIYNLAVENAKLANLAVDEAKLARMSVTNAIIGLLAVEDANIKNLNGSKIDVWSLTADQIRAGDSLPLSAPPGSSLWHFDTSAMSVKGQQPKPGGVYKIQPNGRFGGCLAISRAATNLLYAEGAHQDWSKWGHYSSQYWTSATQYNDPFWGKVFKGVATSVSQYIFDYHPYAFSSGQQYSASLWVRTDRKVKTTANMYLVSYYGGTQHQVASDTDPGDYVELTSEWTYLDFTSTVVSENVPAGYGGFGVLFGNIPEGVTVEIAYPCFTLGEVPVPYMDNTRSKSKLELPITGYNELTIDLNLNKRHRSTSTSDDRHICTLRISSTDLVALHQPHWSNGLLLYFTDTLGNTQYAAIINDFQPYIRDWVPITIRLKQAGGTFYIDGFVDGVKTCSVSYSLTCRIDKIDTIVFGDHYYDSNVLIDELMVDPGWHPDEEILSWHQSNAPFFASQTHIGFGDGLMLTPDRLIGYNNYKETIEIGHDGNFRQLDDAGNEIVFIGRDSDGTPRAYFGGELKAKSIKWTDIDSIEFVRDFKSFQLIGETTKTLYVNHDFISFFSAQPYINFFASTEWRYWPGEKKFSWNGNSFWAEILEFTNYYFIMKVRGDANTNIPDFWFRWARYGVNE